MLLNAALLASAGALAFFCGGFGPGAERAPAGDHSGVLGRGLAVLRPAPVRGHGVDQGENWDFHHAALGGSSYYVLPRVLQWFTGNVGLHHVHHLNSRIPNYRLQECLDGHDLLGTVGRLTLRESLPACGWRCGTRTRGSWWASRRAGVTPTSSRTLPRFAPPANAGRVDRM
jgi:omega-6 fatty acid desaturase (delta-12 desaturase)